MGTKERAYCAALVADWYVLVMSWISLAMYSANIQPAFLCPDSWDTLANEEGLLAPTRSVGQGLPGDLEVIRKEIKGLANTAGQKLAAATFDKGTWGPMWMGFYDKAEATGWLAGDFAPQKDPNATRIRNGNGGVEKVWPNVATRPYPEGITTWAGFRSSFDEPWQQVYYATLYWGFDAMIVDWRRLDTTGINDTSTEWSLGPNALVRVAKVWAKWVMDQKVMDVIVHSTNWYATNYMKYWEKKGFAGIPVSQVAAAQKAMVLAGRDAKAQTTQRTVGSIVSAGVALTVALAAVPIAGTIAAGCAALVTGITAFICWRRRKKKVAVPVMQPLMLRNLSQGECNYFPPGTTLDNSLMSFLAQLEKQKAELAAAPDGVVPSLGPDDPLNPGSPALLTAFVPGTAVDPNATGTATVAFPATAPVVSTSNSGGIAPGTVVPTLQATAAQAVQVNQTAPTSSGTAPIPGQVPWGVIGIAGACALGLAVFLRR